MAHLQKTCVSVCVNYERNHTRERLYNHTMRNKGCAILLEFVGFSLAMLKIELGRASYCKHLDVCIHQSLDTC